eukprot:TRINITY_DN13204_c0_g1_i1.p1 TRINITY_DN13204_c0_g1~~TRINITY_DN13204_c0_g1_i1.p1  ORF type:complete len:348 (-),score=52.79 TRINITY_DN13204_c0_g1_i1:78-1121(-)
MRLGGLLVLCVCLSVSLKIVEGSYGYSAYLYPGSYQTISYLYNYIAINITSPLNCSLGQYITIQDYYYTSSIAAPTLKICGSSASGLNVTSTTYTGAVSNLTWVNNEVFFYSAYGSTYSVSMTSSSVGSPTAYIDYWYTSSICDIYTPPYCPSSCSTAGASCSVDGQGFCYKSSSNYDYITYGGACPSSAGYCYTDTTTSAYVNGSYCPKLALQPYYSSLSSTITSAVATALIVAYVVSGLCFLGCASGIIYCCCVRRRRGNYVVSATPQQQYVPQGQATIMMGQQNTIPPPAFSTGPVQTQMPPPAFNAAPPPNAMPPPAFDAPPPFEAGTTTTISASPPPPPAYV